MASKKIITAEEIETVFLAHQDEIIDAANVEIYNFLGVLKWETHKEGEDDILFKCPKCGNIFESHIRPEYCPECHQKISRVVYQVEREDAFSTFSGYVDLFDAQDESQFFAEFKVSVSLSLHSFELLKQTFNFTKLMYFNTKTKEVVKYRDNKRTHARAETLFRGSDLLWGEQRTFYSSKYSESDRFNALETVFLEENLKASAKLTGVSILSPEISTPVSPPTIEEILGVSVVKCSEELVSKEKIFKAHCLKCDNEWYFEQKGNLTVPIECPYCGTVRGHGRNKEHYFTQSRIPVIYIESSESKVWIKDVDIIFDEAKECVVKAETQHCIEFNQKGQYSVYEKNYAGSFYKVSKSTVKYGCGMVTSIVISNFDGLLKYSGLNEFLDSFRIYDGAGLYTYCIGLNVLIKFISDTIKYPIVEKIVKANLGKEYIHTAAQEINYDAKTVEDAFGLSKALIKYYKKERDLLGDSLDIKLSDFVNLYARFKDITGEDAAWCSYNCVEADRIWSIMHCVPKLSLHQIISYLERVRLMQQFMPRAAITEWRDYLLACKDIGMDLTDRHVLYPRALKTEHDVVVAKRKLVFNESINQDFIKAVEEYKALEYQKGNYLVKTPESMEAMFEEGRKLHHCCGRYVDDVVRKQAIVLFLRKKENPDMPFLSVEITPHKEIRQVRGMNDTYVNALDEHKEVNLFLKAWAKSKHLELKII